MSCALGGVTERLENEQSSYIHTAELIVEAFRHFTYVTTHSPTLPSPQLRHSSFSNPSVASPTSLFILKPFFRFSKVTSSSLNSPGEPMKETPQISKVWEPLFYCTSSKYDLESLCNWFKASCLMYYIYCDFPKLSKSV